MLVYLHIPFCHRVCPYCSFYKHTPGATPIGAFIDALAVEAKSRLAGANPRTLYLGGGTPSMLSPSHLRKLFAALRETIDFDALEEVTLEANPATFDEAKARVFRELGVTRVSLGIQSLEAHVLETLGREHTPEQAAEAVAILRRAGMPSVNIDLMFSIPGQSRGDWTNTIRRAIELQPDHISAYNLTYEEDTAFFDSLKRGEMDADEDRDAEEFHAAHHLLEAAGFLHYETSNYAQPGHESVHNRGYWQGEDYLGLGPSAVSTTGRVRSKNVSDTARYVEMVHALGHATVESEAIDAEAWRMERIALGLRTREGIAVELLDSTAAAKVETLAAEGLALIEDGRMKLTEQGAALVDPIAGELV